MITLEKSNRKYKVKHGNVAAEPATGAIARKTTLNTTVKEERVKDAKFKEDKNIEIKMGDKTLTVDEFKSELRLTYLRDLR